MDTADRTTGALGRPRPDASGHKNALWELTGLDWTLRGPESGHSEERVRSSLNRARAIPVDR
jgi:hypothetical protein